MPQKKHINKLWSRHLCGTVITFLHEGHPTNDKIHAQVISSCGAEEQETYRQNAMSE